MNAIRRATLVVGSILAVSGAGSAAFLGLWGTSYADPEAVSIPEAATSIEIETSRSSVDVMSGGSDRATAVLTGYASALNGAVPSVQVIMRGTTAVITVANERTPYSATPWGDDPHSLSISLPGDRRYDSVTIHAQRPVYAQSVNAAVLDVTANGGDANIQLGSSAPDRVAVQSRGAIVSVLDDGTQWDVVTPAWFESFPSTDPTACAQSNSDPYSVCNTTQSFGVWLTPTPGADHVIDLAGTPDGALIHVGYLAGG